jgi:glycosyltransferase involved in cell wall biosynthesis
VCCKETLENVRPLLSIVLPVYNERATFEQLIQSVLEKKFDIVNREIIIVESNSTDGSRELVQQYENQPGVKVIYENEPRGKGHAVRNGLNHASGSIILIQDADLEYDIDDYDAVIEPIVTFRRLFVLGSRHKGSWKMREFEERKMLSVVFNSGQLFFTWLINVACGTRLKDPFTMYKVFHRECLYGLQLESNRFDLDWEIVIKFVRKGLVPLEIPVNYRSRSFTEGKKIRPILDPILWIIALRKFRYGKLYHSESPQEE